MRLDHDQSVALQNARGRQHIFSPVRSGVVGGEEDSRPVRLRIKGHLRRRANEGDEREVSRRICAICRSPGNRSFTMRREPRPRESCALFSKNKIDMIVAGALEKEVDPSSLSRRSSRAVWSARRPVLSCSSPSPKANRSSCTRSFSLPNDSEHARRALKRTIHLASAESCQRLYVIRIITPFDKARASLPGIEQEEDKDICR